MFIYIVHRKWSHDMKYVAVSLNNAQYCPYSTACRSKIHGCVDPENSLSLIIVVVVVVAVVFSRHWLLSWFAWFIIIMVTAFEILGDRLSIVIMFERSSMVCRSRIKYQIVWEDRVDDFLFSRLTTVQRSRMGRSRELQLWKRKNTKKKKRTRNIAKFLKRNWINCRLQKISTDRTWHHNRGS